MFRRHRKNNGDWVPETPGHHAETPEVQMRIIRTHIAAQATELGNVRHLLQQLIEEIRDRPAH